MRHVHFIGICGKGMGALAVLLKDQGDIVTGSDEGFYEPMFSYLKDHGIDFKTPHSKDNIPEDTDIFVIGKHAKLTVEENEEVRTAFESGKPITTFPEMLGEISKGKENTVVVGSYGKSTCTALLAHILKESNKDPSFFIGALPIDIKEMAYLGNGNDFILEGDEYPTSNTDKKSKFLYLNAKHVLLTSGEHDHINVFPTLESYLKPYIELVNSLESDSILVACINNPNVSEIITDTKAKVVSYGLENNREWCTRNIEFGEITKFDLYYKDKFITNLETPLLGRHNIENIVGVCAMALSRNLVTIEEIKKAISGFHGVTGRLENKNINSSVILFEGYGSSLEKTTSLFEALKLHYPDRKIVTVFEPHTFGWRNKNNLSWYEEAFNGSSVNLILKPPTHGRDSHEQLTLDEIVSETKKNFPDTFGFEDGNYVLEKLDKILEPNDIVIMVTSGDLLGIRGEIAKLIEQKFPN